ncbi:hypothetical protein U3516DRAFT_819408 [Neocallimastix sp. 'constans']
MEENVINYNDNIINQPFSQNMDQKLELNDKSDDLISDYEDYQYDQKNLMSINNIKENNNEKKLGTENVNDKIKEIIENSTSSEEENEIKLKNLNNLLKFKRKSESPKKNIQNGELKMNDKKRLSPKEFKNEGDNIKFKDQKDKEYLIEHEIQGENLNGLVLINYHNPNINKMKNDKININNENYNLTKDIIGRDNKNNEINNNNTKNENESRTINDIEDNKNNNETKNIIDESDSNEENDISLAKLIILNKQKLKNKTNNIKNNKFFKSRNQKIMNNKIKNVNSENSIIKCNHNDNDNYENIIKNYINKEIDVNEKNNDNNNIESDDSTISNSNDSDEDNDVKDINKKNQNLIQQENVNSMDHSNDTLISENKLNDNIQIHSEENVQKTLDWILKYRCISKGVEPTFENLTLVNSIIPLTSQPNQLYSPSSFLLFCYSQTLINSMKTTEPTQTHFENLLLWIETLEIKRRTDYYNQNLNTVDQKKDKIPLNFNKINTANNENINNLKSNLNNSYENLNEQLSSSNFDKFKTLPLNNNKIEKRYENACLLLKKHIIIKELQKKPFNPVNCKALINKLFPVDENDSETIILKHYPSPRFSYISLIFSMEEYLQKQINSAKKNGRKKKGSKTKENKKKENEEDEDTPISNLKKKMSWKQTKNSLEFYLKSIRKCLI